MSNFEVHNSMTYPKNIFSFLSDAQHHFGEIQPPVFHKAKHLIQKKKIMFTLEMGKFIADLLTKLLDIYIYTL